jgi:hypothetical protein
MLCEYEMVVSVSDGPLTSAVALARTERARPSLPDSYVLSGLTSLKLWYTGYCMFTVLAVPELSV